MFIYAGRQQTICESQRKKNTSKWSDGGEKIYFVNNICKVIRFYVNIWKKEAAKHYNKLVGIEWAPTFVPLPPPASN